MVRDVGKQCFHFGCNLNVLLLLSILNVKPHLIRIAQNSIEIIWVDCSNHCEHVGPTNFSFGFEKAIWDVVHAGGVPLDHFED